MSASGGRYLHRDQREQLREVVLDHVTERAGLLIVSGSLLDPDFFGGGDLDMIYSISKSPLAKRKSRRFWTATFPK